MGQRHSDIDPRLGVRLLQATFARATWDGLVRHEVGDDVWSIRVHDSAENVTERPELRDRQSKIEFGHHRYT
jgi:hypothetical protein